ncbi:MAG: FHA domain-containing protein, partial [Polyangiaceae bacterium]
MLAQARATELRGDLSQAAVLFAEGGRPDEASRVMLLRGDAETDPSGRLQHYVQAVATAPEGGQARTLARRKHAELVLAMAADGASTPALRQDLLGAALELEALGDAARAAEA